MLHGMSLILVAVSGAMQVALAGGHEQPLTPDSIVGPGSPAHALPAVPTVPLWVPQGVGPVNLPLSGLGTAFGWGPAAQNVTHDAVLLYLQVRCCLASRSDA
jgi:hypothetical protein